MELSQLRTMICVSELGSLSKASERIRIAQPALSRQIRMLEDELGAQLFDRHGRGMTLTEAGESVLRHAMEVMAQIEKIRNVTADNDQPLTGHVSIGMPMTVSDILCEPLVEAFSSTHPEATLRVVGAYSGNLMDWMRRGEIDASIIYDPRSSQTMNVLPLLDEQLLLVGPPDSGLSLDTEVDFATLAGQKMILPSPGHGLRMVLDRCASDCGFGLRVPFEAESYSALRKLVLGGYGLAVFPKAPIYRDIAEGTLCAAPLRDPTPIRRLVFASPGDRPVPRLVRFAEKTIISTIAKLVEDEVWPGSIPES